MADLSGVLLKGRNVPYNDAGDIAADTVTGYWRAPSCVHLVSGRKPGLLRHWLAYALQYVVTRIFLNFVCALKGASPSHRTLVCVIILFQLQNSFENCLLDCRHGSARFDHFAQPFFKRELDFHLALLPGARSAPFRKIQNCALLCFCYWLSIVEKI